MQKNAGNETRSFTTYNGLNQWAFRINKPQ
jgi:hypothetical protein